MGKWVYKTEAEYQKEISRPPSIWIPVNISLMALFFITVYRVWGLRGKNPYKPIEPIEKWSDFIDVLPMIIGIPLVLFIALFLAQRIWKIDLFETKIILICDKCFEVKHDDGNYTCECSGNFVDIRKMKWVEDDSTIETNDDG